MIFPVLVIVQLVGIVVVELVGHIASYTYVPVAQVVRFHAKSAIRNLIAIVAVGAKAAVHTHALYVAASQVTHVVYAQVAPLSQTVSLTSARMVIDHLKYHVLPLIHVVPILIYPVDTVGYWVSI